MVYRIFVEKKDGFDVEAKAFCSELKTFLGIKGQVAFCLCYQDPNHQFQVP